MPLLLKKHLAVIGWRILGQLPSSSHRHLNIIYLAKDLLFGLFAHRVACNVLERGYGGIHVTVTVHDILGARVAVRLFPE